MHFLPLLPPQAGQKQNKKKIELKIGPRNFSFLNYLYFLNHININHEYEYIIQDPLTRGQELIYISISTSTNISIPIYLYLCVFKLKKKKRKETKIRTAILANVKSKLMGKIFLNFNQCQIRGGNTFANNWLTVSV